MAALIASIVFLLVCTGFVIRAFIKAPEGWEDECTGFHYGRKHHAGRD